MPQSYNGSHWFRTKHEAKEYYQKMLDERNGKKSRLRA